MLLPLLSISSLLIAAGFAAVTWRVLGEERRRAEARVAALGAAIDGRPSPHDETMPLFDTDRQSAVQGAPLAKLAIGCAMAIVAIVVVAMSGGHPRAPQPAAVVASAPGDAAPLELLSMRYQRTGDAFTVTGLVRNAAPTPAHGLIAVVFAFDRSGNFVSSARAPVDSVTLGAGDESPFHVTVPEAGAVGRYRVSFRTEAGVVRHLDRRGALQASAN